MFAVIRKFRCIAIKEYSGVKRDCFKGYSVPDPVLSSYSGYQAVPKTQEEKRESISAGVRTSTDIIEDPLITPMKEVLHLKI